MQTEQEFSFKGLGGEPTRVILYLGKGGVGKTTTAAATAARCADLGHKTLVTSTDVAHSLGDALGVRLTSEPTEVADRLWAQEISAVADLDAHWGEVQEYLSRVMRSKGFNSVVADELSVVPGMDEIVSLIHIRRQATEGNFDRVIVDAAPTGETVRLLTVPDTFRWYASQLGRAAGPMAGVMRPVAERLMSGPAELLDMIERFDAAAGELKATLSDPRIASYRVVTQPEKLVVREAERAMSYLALFGYPVDAVIVNRVVPEGSGDDFVARIRRSQAGYLEYIDRNFAPVPRFRTPYYSEEMIGIEPLLRLAHDCFGEADPGEVFFDGRTQEIHQHTDGRFVLELPMPFVGEGDLDLRKRGDELFIRIGSVKREMLLPRALAAREPVAADLRDDVLSITFEPA